MIVDLWTDLQNPQILWQLLVVAVTVVIAWIATRWLRARFRAGVRRYTEEAAKRGDLDAKARLRRMIGLSDVIFPLLADLQLSLVMRLAPHYQQHFNLLRVVAVLLLSWAVIRLGFYALRRAFGQSKSLSTIERILAVLVWSIVALHITGLLPDAIAAMEDVVIPIGKERVTFWQILKALVSISVMVILALWAGAALETRLMADDNLDNNLRVVFARAGRAILIITAILLSLSLVGIDLTVLSVFGGALGVGLGLGLQRIASSYVSGFIILLDRSLHLNDLITVDKFTGTVTQIRTRYTVIKALDGSEAIIPNDQLVSQTVQNQSYTSRQVRVATRVTVSYAANLDQAMALMVAAAAPVDRVLPDPGPAAYLVSFAADGLELELGFWIIDPEKGTLNVRSDVNLAIWHTFSEHGIEVPFPQREVRVTINPAERAALPALAGAATTVAAAEPIANEAMQNASAQAAAAV